MPRACSVCTHPLRDQIDRRILAGARGRDITDWLGARGARVSDYALYRHRAHVKPLVDLDSESSTVEASDLTIYEQIVRIVSDALRRRVLMPNVRDAILAQRYLDERAKMEIEARVALTVARMLLGQKGQIDHGADITVPAIASPEARELVLDASSSELGNES